MNWKPKEQGGGWIARAEDQEVTYNRYDRRTVLREVNERHRPQKADG